MLIKNLFQRQSITNIDYPSFFRKWGNDYFFAFLFFILGGSIALIFYQKIGYTFFYQNFVPESILWACGQEFAFPKQVITDLIPFLKGEQSQFNCGLLKDIDLYASMGYFSHVQPYLTWSTAILWRWFGVSYQTLNPIIFFLFGLYISGIYLIIRQFQDKALSILATLFISFSPVMTHMVVSLRDFSKAPFIIWGLLLLILTIKEQNKRGINFWALPVMAGITAGIGMGFRSDLFFLLPVGAIFLFIGFSNRYAQGIPKQLFYRASVAFVFLVAFLITASPIIKNENLHGIRGIFIMQGITEPFRASLKVQPSGYSLGLSYSDELTLSGIAAQERLSNPLWDKKEMEGVPGLTVSQSISLGTPNLLKWADLFLGDFTNQSIKSLVWMIGYPLYIANSGHYLSNPFLATTPESLIYKAYKNLGSTYMLVILGIGFLSLLFQCFLRSKSEGLAFLFLFLFLGSYPSIQFDLRHFFYLEFIWILCFLALKNIPQYLRYHKGSLFKFLVVALLFITIITIFKIAINSYQAKKLSLEISKLMKLPREKIDIQIELKNSKQIFLRIPIPTKYLHLTRGKNDSMTKNIGFEGPQWDVRAAAERFFLKAEGQNCNAQDISVNIIYSKNSLVWQPLDASMKILKHSPDKEAGLLFSGFYRPTQSIEGLLIPIEFKNCKFTLEGIAGENRLPYVFSANIEEDRINGALNKGLGGF